MSHEIQDPISIEKVIGAVKELTPTPDPKTIQIIRYAMEETNRQGIYFADVALALHQFATQIVMTDSGDWQEMMYFCERMTDDAQMIGRTSVTLYQMGIALDGNEIRPRPEDGQGEDWDNRLP